MAAIFEDDDLRALTLTQPWCGLVASGIKLIENRQRPVIGAGMIGKRIALHASREIDTAVWKRIAEIAPELVTREHGGQQPDPAFPWTQLATIKSAIIGTAVVVKAFGDWGEESITQYRGELALQLTEYTGRSDQLRWFFGPVAYALRDVHALATPVPCKGALGLWRVPRPIADQVRAIESGASWEGATA